MNHRSQGHGATTGAWLLTQAKANPEGLLLLAAGAALMLRSAAKGGSAQGGRPRQQTHTQGSPDAGWPGSEQLSQAAEGARQYASEIGSMVSDTAGSYAAATTRYVDEATRLTAETSSQFVSDAKSKLEDATQRVLRDQPLVVALAGLAAGAAVAAAFPRTDIERRTLGSAGERLTDLAAETAAQVKNAGLKAGERVMSAAQQRGLSGEGLKDMAQQAADAFGTALSGGESQPGSASGRTAMPGSSGADQAGGSKRAAENTSSVTAPQAVKPYPGR